MVWIKKPYTCYITYRYRKFEIYMLFNKIDKKWSDTINRTVVKTFALSIITNGLCQLPIGLVKIINRYAIEATDATNQWWCYINKRCSTGWNVQKSSQCSLIRRQFHSCECVQPLDFEWHTPVLNRVWCGLHNCFFLIGISCFVWTVPYSFKKMASKYET